MIGWYAIGSDGAVIRVLERSEILPLAGDRIEPQDLGAVRVLDPDLAVDVRIGRREECLLGGVGLPLIRHLPGLEFLGRLVELGNAALIHHRDPEIAGLIGFEVERPNGKAWLDHRQGILGDLAGLGIELAQELFAEMGEPDHAVGIDDGVVRLDLLSRQIVFGDHNARRTPGRARQRLELIVPNLVPAEIDRGEILRHRLHPRRLTEVAASLAQKALRVLRRAAGIVAGHPIEHLHELGRIVVGVHDAIEVVTADAIEQRFLLRVGSGKACKPFRIGELLGQVLGRPQLDVGGRGAGGGDGGALGPIEVIADGSNGQRIAAGRKPRCREAELARAVADDGDGRRRALELGADDHPFHGTVGSGTDLAGQRHRRLRLNGTERQSNRHHAGGHGEQEIARMHRRLLDGRPVAFTRTLWRASLDPPVLPIKKQQGGISLDSAFGAVAQNQYPRPLRAASERDAG